MIHDLKAPNFLKTRSVKQQTAALQNTSFCSHYMITYESCFSGKVNTYLWEVQWSLLTTEVENWTSRCTQLYFVESICKHFVLTDETGSCCNGGLHSLLTRCSGLRSVFWTLSWSRNVAVTTLLYLRSCHM